MKIFLLLTFTVFSGIGLSQGSCVNFEEELKLKSQSILIINEAEELYEQYMKLDCADLLYAYNFMGIVHYNNSNLAKAKEFLIRGENEFFEKEKRPEQFALNQMYTALILIVEKNYKSAAYHLSKAETYAKKSPDKFIISSIYQNIGLVKIGLNELNEAESYLNKSIEIGGLDSISVGYVFQNLASVSEKRGDSEKMIEYMQITKAYWEDLNHARGKYLLSFFEAKHALSENNFNDALMFLKSGRAHMEGDNRLLSGENYLLEAQIQDSLDDKQAKLIALENAIIESTDLSEDQLKKTIFQLSELQVHSKTNLVLADVISKLKFQNINQRKIDLTRKKIMDSELAEDQSVIKSQLKYLLILGSMLLLLTYLFFRVRKQRTDILFLNESLKQKNKQLEQFAYVASHDLKSPLNTISSFAGLLKKKHKPEDANKYLDIILVSSKKMSQMISELLRSATLDEELKLVNVNLKTLIEETLFQIQSQITEAEAKVIVEDNCILSFQCDRILFTNVIQNLVSNAITYCKEDQLPEIVISAQETDGKIIIKFTDNGIGMEKIHQDQIFEMHKRLKIKDVDGSGIGLSTVKKIIEKHSGVISVNSTPGIGSTFIIKMPSVLTK